MRIAASEWRIMEAVWGLEAVGAAEVIAAVQPQTGWNHRTIRTLLNRLVEKGLLSVRKADGRNLYQPRVERSECVRQEAQSFLERVFHGSARELVLHFADSEQLTAADLGRLRVRLKQARSGGRH